MADLTISNFTLGSFPALLLAGELDAYHAPRLRGLLESLLEARAVTVIVDLRQVTYIDSTGLGVLVATRKRADTQGGGLRLIVTSGGAVERTLTITGLLSVFPIFSDETSAQGHSVGDGKDG